MWVSKLQAVYSSLLSCRPVAVRLHLHPNCRGSGNCLGSEAVVSTVLSPTACPLCALSIPHPSHLLSERLGTCLGRPGLCLGCDSQIPRAQLRGQLLPILMSL